MVTCVCARAQCLEERVFRGTDAVALRELDCTLFNLTKFHFGFTKLPLLSPGFLCRGSFFGTLFGKCKDLAAPKAGRIW
jgi:hypothetical protein